MPPVIFGKNDISANAPIFYQARDKFWVKHYSIRPQAPYVHGGDSTVFPGLS